MKKNIKKNVDAHGNGYNSEANHETSSKGSKHDANLRKNGFYHFQIGLILAMLMVYAGLEASFAVKGENIANDTEELVNNVEYYPELTKFKVEAVKTKTVNISKPKVITNPDKITIVDELEAEMIEGVIDDTEVNEGDDIDMDSLSGINDVFEVEDVIIDLVDVAPVFPGCEKAKDKKACFNEKMHRHIRRNFHYPQLQEEMGVEGRVNLVFKIDVDGTITGLQTKSKEAAFEKEAARIINKLPKMKPGKKGNHPVRVMYSLPITFKLK